jgi:diguanylate cyclase (GGDEF)-like protein
LLWVDGPGEVRRVAEDLVRNLGGGVVPADADDLDALPVDISFGDGPPMVATAPSRSPEREQLERHLAEFVSDAQRALDLGGRVDRLAEAAAIDALTGLPNRRMLDRALDRLVDDDVVVILDLDHFKTVNDEFGHPAGDEVLRRFGAAMRATVRSRDLVARLGGEEFVIVLRPPEGAEAFLGRLRDEWAVQRPRPVTFSAGIARATRSLGDPLARADQALYRAKRAGRDRWVWDESAESARNGGDR